MNADYLAFDLGAESGRAMLGRLRSGILYLTEIHRFPNKPLSENGSLRLNVRGLWTEMRSSLDRLRDVALASIGVDAWGVDYALIDERGELVGRPKYIADHEKCQDHGERREATAWRRRTAHAGHRGRQA